MAKFLKRFQTTAQYNAYAAGADFITPNVSLCDDDPTVVHYNPHIATETRVVAKFNVTDTANPTELFSEWADNPFSAIEIDGVVQPSVVSAYTFSTTGEHTVKYTLTDPTSIGKNAFNGCSSLTSIDIPSCVTSIGKQIFYNCSGLTSIDIPSGVTTIGDDAFYRCTSLTSVTIPDNVTSIGDNVFSNCSGLTSCVIGKGVTSISENMFLFCDSLTGVTIGENVTSIDTQAFQACHSLISVVIPNSVTNISNYAFDNCNSLTSVTIGNSVTSIGVDALSRCSSLEIITCYAMTAPSIIYNTFANVKTGGTLYVPAGSSGYNTWMGTGNYYLGKYNWTKVEQ